MNARMIPANGIKLHVVEYPNNGPTVILLHYGRATGAVWNGVVPHLVHRYHVVVPDMRGYGRSEQPTGGYDMETAADDIVAMMDAMSITQAHLVGSSMGAEVALALAARYPERVVTLTVGGAFQNPFGPHGEHDVADDQVEAKKAELRAARAARPQLTYASRDEMYAAMQDRWQQAGLWNEHFAAAVAYDIGETAEGRYAQLSPQRVTDAYMECYWDTRFERYWAQVTCPTLFLVAGTEVESEAAQASLTWFRSLVPESHLTVVPGAYHALMVMTHPLECAQAVMTFHAQVGSAQ